MLKYLLCMYSHTHTKQHTLYLTPQNVQPKDPKQLMEGQ